MPLQVMENPVLKRDLKIRFRLRNLIKAVFVRYACIGLIFILALLSQIGNNILSFIIAQAVTIMLFIPATIYDAFASKIGKRDMRELAFTRLNPMTVILGKVVSANIYNFIIIIFSFIFLLIISLSQKKVSVSGIIYSNIVTIAIMSAISAVSLFFCAIFRKNVIASTILPYFVILLLLFSVIISGPFIDRTESQQFKKIMINSALYASPAVNLARASGKIDIMRTLYLYTIADPIVGRGFSYPDWRISCTIYVGISILLLFIASLLIRLRKTDTEYEEMKK